MRTGPEIRQDIQAALNAVWEAEARLDRTGMDQGLERLAELQRELRVSDLVDDMLLRLASQATTIGKLEAVKAAALELHNALGNSGFVMESFSTQLRQAIYNFRASLKQ